MRNRVSSPRKNSLGGAHTLCQELADRFLGLDSKEGYDKEEEFVIYGACVGR